MGPSMGPPATFAWSTHENSLVRHSLNAIVDHRRCDVPDSILFDVNMGRKAELGPFWVPPGVKAKRLGQMAYTRPSLTPRPQPCATTTVPRRLDNNFEAIRTITGARPREEVLVGAGGLLSWQTLMARADSNRSTS